MGKKAIEIVCENRKKIVDKIIERLEQGHGIWKPNWKPSNLLPNNPISGARYNGINRFILSIMGETKGYDDSRWITIKQAIDKGYKLKDNEEGIVCEKWIWERKTPVIDEETGKEKLDENGNKIYKIKELKKPLCKYFKLYNAEQFENFPKKENNNLMENWKHEEKQMFLLDIADNFITSSECPIHEIDRNKNCYIPSIDEIHLVPRKQFKSAEAFLGTLLHEMAHSTGDFKRLNRGFKNNIDKNEYAMEELIAELSTTFLEADLGINLEFENTEHLDYLGSWIDILKEDPNVLHKVCKNATEVSEFLMDNYERIRDREKYYQEDEEAI